MPDILETYNAISDAADRAIQRTSALIQQSRTLSSVGKGMAGVAWHGAMGPGMMLYDPVSRLARGESGIGGAAKDFIAEAKKLEIGGQIAAKSVESLSNKVFSNSEKITKSTGKITTFLKDMTNTSKWMDDTLKSLAGRTGLLANSFKGLAQTIKVTTGPIGTALLVTTTAYDQFVKRWMENSAKLRADIEEVSTLFEGDTVGVRAGMAKWTARGGTRQGFLNLMKQAEPYNSQIGQGQAISLAQLANVISSQTGENRSQQFNKLLEHFYVRKLTGASEEEMNQERLRMRVISGTSRAGERLKGPLQRYREWGEDVGTRLNNAAEGWSSSEIRRGMAFSQVGPGIWTRAREGIIRNLNREMGVGVSKLPIIPGVLNIEDIGKGIMRGASALEMGSANWDIRRGQELMRLAGAKPRDPAELARLRSQGMLGQAGEDLGEEERRRTHLRGQLQELQGLRKKLAIGMRPEEERVIGAQTEIEQKGQILAAYEMSEKWKKASPKVNKQLADVASKMKSGDIEGAKESLENLQKETGASLEDIMRWVEAINKFKDKIPKSAEEAKRIAEEIKKTQETTNKAIEKLDQARELYESLEDKQLSEAGLKLKRLKQLPAYALEKEERLFQKRRSDLLKDINVMESSGKTWMKSPEGKIVSLTRLKAKLKESYEKELGMTTEEYSEAQKKIVEAEAGGDIDKANELREKLKDKVDRSIINQGRKLLREKAGDLDEKRRETSSKIENLRLPSMMENYRARGIITESQQKEIEKLRDPEGNYGTLEAKQAHMKLQEFSAQYQAKLQKIENVSIPIRREAGIAGLNIAMGSQARRGIEGPENAIIRQVLGSGDNKLIDASQSTMKNILSIRENMYRQEIAFTLQYARTRMQIIQTHYENANQLERGRLTQLDQRFAPYQEYGQAIFGLQGTMAQAQMGRYAGEDWGREQYRGARGLGEQRMGILMGASGYRMPREMQIAWALRSNREARGDFLRRQQRQRETDTLGTEGMANTERMLQEQLGGPGQLQQFYRSEGGRRFLMQMLQQNQGAFSRQGVDVSGRIRRLAQEQQGFEARKLATSLRIRGRETTSMEEQTRALESDLSRLPAGKRQAQEVKVALAEQYKRLSNQYLSTGDIRKAEEASKRQEELLKSIPEEMKKDFGDTVKQQLNELKMHTEILKAINQTLGGKVATSGSQTTGKGGAPSKATGQIPTARQIQARPNYLPGLPGEVDRRALDEEKKLSEIDHRAPTGTGKLYTTELARREGRELTRDEKIMQGFSAGSYVGSRFIGDVEHRFPRDIGRHPFDKNSWKGASVFEGGIGFNIAPNTPGSEGYVDRSSLGDMKFAGTGEGGDSWKRAHTRGLALAEQFRGPITPKRKLSDMIMDYGVGAMKSLAGRREKAEELARIHPELADKAMEGLAKIRAITEKKRLRKDYTQALGEEGWEKKTMKFTRPDRSSYESYIFSKGGQTMTMDQDQLDRAAMEWRRTTSMSGEETEGERTKKDDQRDSIDKFIDGAEKIAKAGDKLEKISIDVNVHGGQGTATVSQGSGGYGRY